MEESGAQLHFDDDWRDEAALRDGTVVHLRLIRPEDKEMLRRGFDRLSPASRYRRFFTNKDCLTERELRYLTKVDNIDHVAIGAARYNPDGTEEGLGVARMIRFEDRPDVAEVAIAVVDEAQHKGLGTLLFTRLVAAAKERGIHRFESVVLGSNKPMLELLRRTASDQIEWKVSQGMVTVTYRLPDLPPEQPPHRVPRQTVIQELLAMAAKGMLEVRKLFPRRHKDEEEE